MFLLSGPHLHARRPHTIHKIKVLEGRSFPTLALKVAYQQKLVAENGKTSQGN